MKSLLKFGCCLAETRPTSMLPTYPSVLNLKLKLQFNTKNKIETLSNRSWIAQRTSDCRCVLFLFHATLTDSEHLVPSPQYYFRVGSESGNQTACCRTTFGVYHSCSKTGSSNGAEHQRKQQRRKPLVFGNGNRLRVHMHSC